MFKLVKSCTSPCYVAMTHLKGALFWPTSPDERVAQAVFTKDGTQDVRRDKWCELQDGVLVLAPLTAFHGRGEWSGATWFFHKDANREGVP